MAETKTLEMQELGVSMGNEPGGARRRVLSFKFKDQFTGSEYVATAEGTKTVSELKSQIEEESGIEASALIHPNGTELDTQKLISDYEWDEKVATGKVKVKKHPTFGDTAKRVVARYAAGKSRSARAFAFCLFEVITCFLGSLFVAGCAQISFLLPYEGHTVPVTFQTFAVLFLGALLGKWRGFFASGVYVAEGTFLPFFAMQKTGHLIVKGPTGGYLIALPIASFLTGFLASKGFDRRLIFNFVCMLLGNIVIYIVGIPWLAQFMTYTKAFQVGLLPFLVGDFIKLVLATILLPLGWKIFGMVKDKKQRS